MEREGLTAEETSVNYCYKIARFPGNRIKGIRRAKNGVQFSCGAQKFALKKFVKPGQDMEEA